MRRFSLTNTAFFGTRCASFGAAVSEADISKATRVAGASSTLRPAEASWASLDIIRRQRHGALAATVTSEPLFQIRNSVIAGPAPKVVDTKAVFSKGDFKTVAEMVKAYEEAMYPLRKLYKQAADWQIDVYGLNDSIRLGLNLYSQEVLDEKKKQLVETVKKLEAARAEIKSLVEKNWSTAVFNDIVNVLRIAGQTQEHARDEGMRILDDMSQFGVPMDGDSQMLLKNLVFGDGPQEDSNLLFTYCEFPERGEVSISNGSLEQIADDCLKTIADRHQTPLTGKDEEMGKLLRKGETLPLLQRSSD